MLLPQQSPGVRTGTSLAASEASGAILPAGVFDWLCNWFQLPWCDPPREACYYHRTETSCWGVVLMCKDRGHTAAGRSCSGGWYACGICLGLPF